MPLYIATYLADTGHLRAAESGAYLHLIMHYWQHNGLPTDDRQLATIAKMTDAEWSNAKALLEPLFKLGGWRHKRVEDEIARAEQKYQKRAAAGQKGGRRKQCASNASAGLNHDSVLPSEELSLSDKQDSFKLEVKEEKKDPVVTRARAKHGCRLPQDWQPTLDDLAFARTTLSEDAVKRQVDVFRDYWHARAGPTGVKLDWSATWRNWIRRESENGNRHRNGSQNGSGKNQQGRGHSALAGDYFGRHATEID